MDAEPDLTTRHVNLARAGEARSLGWVIERFTPLLLAQARYRLGPRGSALADPEDVVQDVWATALPRLGELQLRAGRATPVLLAYLGTTLLNRVNNLLRKRADLLLSGKDDSDPLMKVPEATRGPLTLALAGESESLVGRALAALEERDRELVVLRGVEQLSNAEAGALLGMTPAAVSKAYGRALAKLREKLPGSVFDELE